MISDQAKKEIDFWVTKYPEGRQSSAVMQALTIVQNENNGSLTGELMQEVADHLQMPSLASKRLQLFMRTITINQLASTLFDSVTIFLACLMAQMS